MAIRVEHRLNPLLSGSSAFLSSYNTKKKDSQLQEEIWRTQQQQDVLDSAFGAAGNIITAGFGGASARKAREARQGDILERIDREGQYKGQQRDPITTAEQGMASMTPSQQIAFDKAAVQSLTGRIDDKGQPIAPTALEIDTARTTMAERIWGGGLGAKTKTPGMGIQEFPGGGNMPQGMTPGGGGDPWLGGVGGGGVSQYTPQPGGVRTIGPPIEPYDQDFEHKYTKRDEPKRAQLANKETEIIMDPGLDDMETGIALEKVRGQQRMIGKKYVPRQKPAFPPGQNVGETWQAGGGLVTRRADGNIHKVFDPPPPPPPPDPATQVPTPDGQGIGDVWEAETGALMTRDSKGNVKMLGAAPEFSQTYDEWAKNVFESSGSMPSKDQGFRYFADKAETQMKLQLEEERIRDRLDPVVNVVQIQPDGSLRKGTVRRSVAQELIKKGAPITITEVADPALLQAGPGQNEGTSGGQGQVPLLSEMLE